MHNIRKMASKWYVNIPLCLLMLSFMMQCQSETENASRQSEHSGEELFTAVFFAYGDVALQLSTQRKTNEKLQSLPDDAREDYTQRINLYVKYISESDPDFFKKFKSDMDSKNHNRIRNALDDGAQMVVQHFDKVFPELQPLVEKVKEDVQNESFTTNGELDILKVEKKRVEYERLLENNMLSTNGRKMACTIGLACAVYLVLAVHEYVAITLAAAVAIMTWVYIAFGEFPIVIARGTDPLQIEMMVDEMTKI